MKLLQTSHLRIQQLLYLSQMTTIFEGQQPQNALEAIIDCNLRGSYPFEEVFKVSGIASVCLIYYVPYPCDEFYSD